MVVVVALVVDGRYGGWEVRVILSGSVVVAGGGVLLENKPPKA